jgi:hypothetical protein
MTERTPKAGSHPEPLRGRLRVGCLAFLLVWASGDAAVAADSTSPDPTPPDPCGLLLAEEIRAVQDLTVVARIPSTRRSAEMRVLQCFYRTEEHNRSVSLALSVPAAAAGDGARRYWQDRFHPAAGYSVGKRQPPLPVEGLGGEAFWVGDAVTGALYVLAGDGFLRLSVGGVPDETIRRAHSAALAEQALSRIAATSPPPGGPR